MKKLSDKERLDLLDNMTGRYTGQIVLRMSTTGRGWRLHESSQKGYSKVRDAIDAFANMAAE